MTKRRYVPRKKLGSKRIDLPLTKKKEYLRRIITLKQPYNEVRKIYMKEFGKDLPHNTFRHWRKNGAAIFDADFRGVNYRACTKQTDIIDKFKVATYWSLYPQGLKTGDIFCSFSHPTRGLTPAGKRTNYLSLSISLTPYTITPRRIKEENSATNNVIFLKKRINLPFELVVKINNF